MKDFRKAKPDRAYEVYCPSCKQREALPWKDMEWLAIYQRCGQHPHYRCQACPTDNYGVHPRMQVRPVRIAHEPLKLLKALGNDAIPQTN